MKIRRQWLMLAACCAAVFSGCRCCCLLEPYAAAIDYVKDYPILFDSWYNPRLDISRAGKPDWCGPVNRLIGPCRCCDQPEWTRYDDIWLYPPRYMYNFPNHSYPGPTQSLPPEKSEYSNEPESAPLEPTEIPPPPLPEPPKD
jgi:hypothetical protein